MDFGTEQKMIFIVGMSRSGTTMLGRVIGVSKDVHTFEELHFFDSLVSSEDVQCNAQVNDSEAKNIIIRLLTSADENIFAEPNSKKWDQASSEILDQLLSPCSVTDIYKQTISWYTRAQGKQIPCEQTPRYIFSLNDIFHVFPDARIVNLIRDPRDVLLSQKNKWRIFGKDVGKMPLSEALRVWSNYTPIIQSIMWRTCVEKILLASDDKRILSVRYEDLTSNPKETIMQICDHVGIEYSDEMLTVTKIGSSIVADSSSERGIDASFSGRWRRNGGLSRREISVCEYYCREHMNNLGYEMSKVNRSRLDVYSFFPILVFKGALAVLLNFRRSRSITTLIKNRLGLKS